VADEENMGHPSTEETIAFWAQILLANIRIAAGSGLWPIPFLLMALAIRGPYWLRLLKRRRVA
jgi:hypothetical protein